MAHSFTEWFSEQFRKADFLSNCWETKPVLTQIPTEHVHAVSTPIRFLLETATANCLAWGDIQLAHAGAKLSAWQDLTKFSPSGDLLRRANSQGDTVIFNDVQRFISWIDDLCACLETLYNFPVNANCYWTPAFSQGLSVHVDAESVFVIQVEGEKQWQVDLSRAHSAGDGADYTSEESSPRISEHVMSPGSIFYLPRGLPHSAKALSSDSIHITFALSPITWRSLLHYVVDHVSGHNDSSDACLPLGFLEDESGLVQELETYFGGRFGKEPLQLAVEDFVGKTFLLPFHSKSRSRKFAVTGDGLTVDTVIRKSCPGVCRVRQLADTVIFLTLGAQLTGPEWVYEEFLKLASSEAIAINEISKRLSDASKVTLARRFLQEGIFYAC